MVSRVIVDIDDLGDLAIEQDVSAVPTVLAIKNGKSFYQGCGANYTGAAPVRTTHGAPKKLLVRCGAAPVQCLFVCWAVRCAPVQLLSVRCCIGAP